MEYKRKIELPNATLYLGDSRDIISQVGHIVRGILRWLLSE